VPTAGPGGQGGLVTASPAEASPTIETRAERAALVMQRHSRKLKTRIAKQLRGLPAPNANEDSIRQRNALALFPDQAKGRRSELLEELRTRLDAVASVDWDTPLPARAAEPPAAAKVAAMHYTPVPGAEPADDDAAGPHVSVDIPPNPPPPGTSSRWSLSEPRTAAPPLPASKPPSKGFLKRAQAMITPRGQFSAAPPSARDSAAWAASHARVIQARFRGERVRLGLRLGGGDANSIHVFAPRALLLRLSCLAPLILIFLLLNSPWLVPLVLCGYIYLRLPFFLGWLAGQLVRRLGMFGYPISFGAIHLGFWLRLSPGAPIKLELRLCVEDFRLENPPSMLCLNQDFVKVGQVDTVLSVDLGFLGHLLRTGQLLPVLLDFKSCELRQAKLVFELKGGRFNVNELVCELATREVRAKLTGALHMRFTVITIFTAEAMMIFYC